MKKTKITLNLIDGTKDTRQKKIVIFQKQKNPDLNRYLIGDKTSGPNRIRRRRLFAHASQGRHPIIPIFQYPNIPSFQL